MSANTTKRPNQCDDNSTVDIKRHCADDKDVFTFTVVGKENYKMLCHVRDFLELAALVTQAQILAYKKMSIIESFTGSPTL